MAADHNSGEQRRCTAGAECRQRAAALAMLMMFAAQAGTRASQLVKPEAFSVKVLNAAQPTTAQLEFCNFPDMSATQSGRPVFYTDIVGVITACIVANVLVMQSV